MADWQPIETADANEKILQALGLLRKGECWCDTGDGHPHSQQCLNAQRLWRLTVELMTAPPMKTEHGDWVCEHGTAMDVHCCNCHSGFLFGISECTCLDLGRSDQMADWQDISTAPKDGTKEKIRPCSRCGGSGSLSDMTCCPTCGGGGMVWMPLPDPPKR